MTFKVQCKYVSVSVAFNEWVVWFYVDLVGGTKKKFHTKDLW